MIVKEKIKKIKNVKYLKLKAPVKLVFELHTERDDIELFGRATIVEISSGKLIDDNEEEWDIKDVYPESNIYMFYKFIEDQL